MKAELSVVVPVLNRAGLIERSLDSIAAQDVRPLKLYVVDNGSTDGTPDVVRFWMERHARDKELEITLLEESRPGAARARQTGLEHVTTEWVHFFDSDDEMLPGILSEALSQKSGLDMVCWNIEVRELDGSIIRPLRRRNLVRGHMFNALLCTPSYIVRTDYILAAGGWNPEALVWDDWELGVRLIMKAPRVRRLERSGLTVYRQAESITGTGFIQKQGMWEHILDMVADEVRDDRRLLEMVDYRRVILAAHYQREGHAPSGRELLEKTLAETTCAPWRKALLRLIYRYTAAGGRAAYKLWR